MKWINTAYTNKRFLEKLSEEFQRNKPFSHLVMPRFLVTAVYIQLRQALLQEPFELKSSDLFEMYQTKDLRTASGILKEFQAFLSSRQMHNCIKNVTGISTKGSVDASGSLYKNTQYLLPHDDRLESRKVAFMLYCSSLRTKEGGQLDMFSSDQHNPTLVQQSYCPEENTFIIFEVSHKSWHQVREVIDANRFSIGGWFHA